MGAQLRVYKRRIRSVTATKKITKAMEMIAASRVVKAERRAAASTPYAHAKKVAAPLIEAIETETAEGGVDKLHIVFTEFVSMMTQTALDDRLLPLSLEEVAKEAAPQGEILPLYDFEPSAEDVLDALLP